MSSGVNEVGAKNFDSFVSKGNVIIDFWAAWCGPCRILSPVVEEIAGERKDVKFGKLNIEEEYDIAEKFGVMSIPTLIFFKNGQQVEQTVGALSKDMLTEKINETFG